MILIYSFACHFFGSTFRTRGTMKQMRLSKDFNVFVCYSFLSILECWWLLKCIFNNIWVLKVWFIRFDSLLRYSNAINRVTWPANIMKRCQCDNLISPDIYWFWKWSRTNDYELPLNNFPVDTYAPEIMHVNNSFALRNLTSPSLERLWTGLSTMIMYITLAYLVQTNFNCAYLY